jgi:hypothetical protein
METKVKLTWEDELQAMQNAIISFKMYGYEVIPNHNGFRKKTTFFLRDDKGHSLTGSWNYGQLNHFIFGYGKALKNISTNEIIKGLSEMIDSQKQTFDALMKKHIALENTLLTLCNDTRNDIENGLIEGNQETMEALKENLENAINQTS